MAVKNTSKASRVAETNYTVKERNEEIEKLKKLNLHGQELVDKIDELNSKLIIPTGRNFYKFCKDNPDSVFAASLARVEKTMDLSDEIYLGFSSGKDSTVSANLYLMELNRRYLRYALNVSRDGEDHYDILDEKWAHKRLYAAMQDAEVVFTLSNEYSKRFLAKYGPEGLDLLNFSWYCLEMSWQSGVNFDSGVLVSWDKNKKSSWVQPMPTKKELHGFDVVSEDNFFKCNPVALSSLSEEAQEYHRTHHNVVKVPRKDLFGIDLSVQNTKQYWEEPVEAVANYGRGPILSYSQFSHEKDFNHDYSKWFVDTSWLVNTFTKEYQEKIREAQAKRYPELADDVWQMTPATSHIEEWEKDETSFAENELKHNNNNI